MWLFDKHGNAINMDQVMGIFVDADGDNPGYYEVKANGATNVLVAQFAVNAPMSQAAATALFARMSDMLGTTDLSQ